MNSRNGEAKKVLHSSRRRQEIHSLFCALTPGQVFLSLDIQNWLENTVLGLRWLWATQVLHDLLQSVTLQWSNMGTFCSPNSEVALMFIPVAEFHIYTHRTCQRNRSRSSLDLKPNGISVVGFFSLPLLLFLTTPGPLISAFTPSASTTIPEFQICFLRAPADVYQNTELEPDRIFCYNPFPPLSGNTHRLKYSLLFSEWKHMIVHRSTQLSFDFFPSICLLLKEKSGPFGAWALRSLPTSPVNSLGHLHRTIQPHY